MYRERFDQRTLCVPAEMPNATIYIIKLKYANKTITVFHQNYNGFIFSGNCYTKALISLLYYCCIVIFKIFSSKTLEHF